MGEEKCLGAPQAPKASLLSLPIPGRPVALFNQVVLTLGR
jgi:hypothetical protein